MVFKLPSFVNLSYNKLHLFLLSKAFDLSLPMYMAKFFKYGLIGLLVIFFMYAGTGLNVARYCCALCAEYGVEHIAHVPCKDIHQYADHASTHSHMCDGNASKTCDCCKLYRFVTDEGFTQEILEMPDVVKVQLLASVNCALLPLFSSLSIISDAPSDDSCYVLDASFDEGRHVLSRHCVLLI